MKILITIKYRNRFFLPKWQKKKENRKSLKTIQIMNNERLITNKAYRPEERKDMIFLLKIFKMITCIAGLIIHPHHASDLWIIVISKD